MLNLVGLRPFAEPEAITALIATDPDYHAAKEPVSETSQLLIFSTSSQKTWLVFTPLRVYCVLDSRDREKPALRWSMNLQEFLEKPLDIKEYSDASSALDVGIGKDWLVSRHLFPEGGIDQVLRETATKFLA